MPKRKAVSVAVSDETINEEEEENGVLTESNHNIPKNTQSRSQINTQINTPKRKRVSQAFSDLSHLNDANESRTSQSDQSAPCSGVIERVYLKNFKCHSLLEFNLHPYINFILGRNGSGKSAVMDAIILCLGGRANSTGRQAAAKTFIKTNNDKAELSVTIRNVGEDAYKPKEYGSRITIERKLSRDGAGGYRILNDQNKLVSTKKQEVDNIVEQFNIQVSNPVCFLNQETSKHFLNSSNKSTKYQFFMKASQLDSMKRIQEQIEVERQTCINLINDRKSHMPKLEQELFVWEEKYKKCQSGEKLRKKKLSLMHEYTWAVVINTEKINENEKKNLAIQLKSQEKHEKKLTDSQEKLEQTNLDYKQIKENISGVGEKYRAAKIEALNANENFKKIQIKHKSVMNETKRLKLQHDKRSKEADQMRKELEKQRNENQNDHEEERKQKEEKIKATEQQIKEKHELERSKHQEVQTYATEVDTYERQINEKNFEIKSYESNIRECKTNIENLKKSSNDQIYRYGQQMANLVKDIETFFQQGKFNEKPRGPIGMYIKSRDDEYSLAIEQCLGGLLTSFLCATYHDERVLQELFRKHYRNSGKPSITTKDFNDPLYDHTRYRPTNRDYPTVYEMLDIPDNVVANTLMDQRGIEAVFLLPNYETARRLVESGNGQDRIQEAFTPNGDQYLCKPSFRTYSCPFKTPRVLIKNTDNVIQELTNKIEQIKQRIPVIHQNVKLLNQELVKNKQLKDQNDKQMYQIRKEINSLKNQLDEAKNIQIPEPVDLAVYEEELKRLENEKEKFLKEIEQIETNSGISMNEYEQAEQHKNKCEEEVKNYEATVDELKLRNTKFTEERDTLQEDIKHYRKLLDDVLIKTNKIQDTLRDQEAELGLLTTAALDLCERIETRRQAKAIDAEMTALENQIKQNEKLNGNEEEITRNYLSRKETYKQIQTDIKKQTAFNKKLLDVMKLREEALTTLTESKAMRCTIDFSNYLKSRNYNGFLKFDHQQQTLEVNVHPNKSKDAHEDRDVKSLSGGERSFSTVAFLLSLWSIVESPILFLDEFDVFMDQLNRKIVMELILNSAKEKLNGQYVFLTPQEMGYINPDEHVKLFKMPDPQRMRGEQVENNENIEN